MDKEDLQNIFTGFGFTLLGITVGFSAKYLYNYISDKLTSLFITDIDTDNSLMLDIREIIENVDEFDINNLDINNPIDVLGFIEKHFIRDLIVSANNHISVNYNILTSNEAFYNLIKKVFETKENRDLCIKSLQNSFDRRNFYFFFDKINQSKSLDDFMKIERSDKIMSKILSFLVKKFNI